MEFKRSIRVKLVTHVTLFNVNMIVGKNINQAFFLLKCDRLLSNDEQMQRQASLFWRGLVVFVGGR